MGRVVVDSLARECFAMVAGSIGLRKCDAPGLHAEGAALVPTGNLAD